MKLFGFTSAVVRVLAPAATSRPTDNLQFDRQVYAFADAPRCWTISIRRDF